MATIFDPTTPAPAASAPKFTPGPWTDSIEDDEIDQATVICEIDCYTIISATQPHEVGEEEVAANIRLIKAAPKMYELLEDARRLTFIPEWYRLAALKLLREVEGPDV